MSATARRINMASDPVLPQRDLLLDPAVVAGRLASRLGASGPLTIASCERLRTKYRVGDSLRVLHRIRIGDSDYTVAARAFPEGRSERAYTRALSTVVNCAPLRAIAHDARLETVFWTFPNDRKLCGLQSLMEIPADRARSFIPAWTRSRVVAYAPEKCATAECLDERSNILAYAKIYRGDEGRRIYGVYESLRSSLHACENTLSLPRAVAYVESQRLLLLEPVAGRRMDDLRGLDLLRGYGRLGAALAMLHGLPVPAGLPPSERLQVRRLQQVAQLIFQARPDVGREVCELADELTVRSEPASETHVCLHGDVHPKNAILRRGDCLTLIDLDQAAAGPAAVDLGSLLASLAYNHLGGLLSQRDAHALGDAFLAGYASVSDLPEESAIRWHTSAALLAERALRAVNRVRPEGLARLPQLLAGAGRILQSGGVG